MRVLCLCQGGNVRSVAVSYLLRYGMTPGHDALAAGWEKNTAETRDMLYRWADRIVVVEPSFVDHVPEEFRGKVVVLNIGPDRWFNSLHRELLTIAGDLLSRNMTLTPTPFLSAASR